MREIKQEGWVKFERFHCKEGFIDRWIGDAINNPNNKEKSLLNLNSFKTYYRLDGKGGWIESSKMERSFVTSIAVFCNNNTSKDIWEDGIKDGEFEI